MKTNHAAFLVFTLLLGSTQALAWENHDLLKNIRPGIYELTNTVKGDCPKRVWAQLDSSGENFSLTDITDPAHTSSVFQNWQPIDGPVNEVCRGGDMSFRSLDFCYEDDDHTLSYTDGQRIYNKEYQTGIFFLENDSYQAYVEFNNDQITWYDQECEGSIADPSTNYADPNQCVFQFTADH